MRIVQNLLGNKNAMKWVFQSNDAAGQISTYTWAAFFKEYKENSTKFCIAEYRTI